ncbi:MAG: hypothetical protein EPO41_03780 [Reyranella sp.]|uniref:hypothetical protein n=1 Tax=Reyranella sp. TaxID=1929291 RepID=UPI00121FB438|nr:hypothetical protein [Reyranella sp.]TAJ97121.1 MAG: hypothetical protein EPO41_03780 [Reyranella sp.]
MQVINRELGAAPVEKIVLELTGPEYETVLRSLRRMQIGANSYLTFTGNDANITRAHKRRAEHLHRELTGRAR